MNEIQNFLPQSKTNNRQPKTVKHQQPNPKGTRPQPPTSSIFFKTSFPTAFAWLIHIHNETVEHLLYLGNKGR